MKKNILAMGIAAAIAAPVAMADAPTVYGQFNVAVEYVDLAGAENTDAASRNSRIGIKGSEDLGNGMKAVYQFETTITAGGGSASGFGGQRNTFVGLAGGFGTIVAGRHDTPLRMIQPSDGFADNTYAGNNTSRFNGGIAGEHRLNEVVAYLNKFGEISVAAAITGHAGLEEANKDQTLTQGRSLSVAHGSKGKGIYLAAGMTDADALDDPIIRATAQYNEAGLLASAMYNNHGDDSAITLGVAYKMGQITPRAKVASVDIGGETGTNFAMGADYALGKKTRVYAEYVTINDKAGSVTDVSGFSVGIFHKF